MNGGEKEKDRDRCVWRPCTIVVVVVVVSEVVSVSVVVAVVVVLSVLVDVSVVVFVVAPADPAVSSLCSSYVSLYRIRVALHRELSPPSHPPLGLPANA